MEPLDLVAALRHSVIAVPPLAWRGDGTLDREQNARILAHLRTGGVRTFMYGGNANVYHLPPALFVPLVDLLAELSQPGDWFIPSVGSDYGKALEQLRALRRYDFPTAMVLPHRAPTVPGGVAAGLQRLAAAYGRPIVAYVKDDGYIDAAALARLVGDGSVCAVKYAIVRRDPADDPFLEELLARIDPARVVSGIGERPAIVHWTRFGLRAFTSGSVCVAPALSNALHEALQRDDLAEAERLRALFLALEDLRDAYSPILVLHEAVRLAGIAETGPILPFLANLDEASVLAEIGAAARALRAANDAANDAPISAA
jgi:dihydrodipicolinate synthase/N-acetylneuraminate lyase